MRTFLTSLAVAATSTIALSQFAGGSADGFDARVLRAQTLAGQPAGVVVLYLGGSGDGFDHHIASVTLSGADLTQLYGGGRGDGFDANATAASVEGTSLAILYGGGIGDGFDESVGSTTLGGQSLALLYGGGAGDGFDANAVNLVIDGVSVAQLYGGGPGDGFDARVGNFTLDGTAIAVLYGGGAGDGFDHRTISVVIDGTTLAQLYGGGPGDGFDVLTRAGLIINGTAVPLPLTLLAFGAEFTSDDLVLVTWTTTDERGTDFLVVERAADAVAFAELGEVDALGQGLAAGVSTDYRFADAAPLAGTGYYRLRIHDADGAVAFSEVVALSRQVLAKAAPWQYTLYPNPNAGNELYVAPVNLPADPALEVEVRDALGRLVYRATEDYPGSGEVRLTLQRRLPAGTYVVRVRSGETQQTKILIVSNGGM